MLKSFILSWAACAVSTIGSNIQRLVLAYYLTVMTGQAKWGALLVTGAWITRSVALVFAGPLLAAWLIATNSYEGAFLFNSLTFLLVLAAVYLANPEESKNATTETLRQHMQNGLKSITSSRSLVLCGGGIIFGTLLVTPVAGLFHAMGQIVLGGNEWTNTALAITYGTGLTFLK